MYKLLKFTALILVVIGALNWGLVGLFDFNLVTKLFGDMSTISRIIYSLVGVAGLGILIMIPFCYKHHNDDL